MLCSDMGIMLLKFDSIATAEKLVHALNEDRQQQPWRPSLSVALRTDTLSHGFYWRFAEPDGALRALDGSLHSALPCVFEWLCA